MPKWRECDMARPGMERSVESMSSGASARQRQIEREGEREREGECYREVQSRVECKRRLPTCASV